MAIINKADERDYIKRREKEAENGETLENLKFCFKMTNFCFLQFENNFLKIFFFFLKSLKSFENFEISSSKKCSFFLKF